jgi:hypothetical protein
MNNVEKAFTLRLYCPRKQLVKRGIGSAFPSLIVARRLTRVFDHHIRVHGAAFARRLAAGIEPLCRKPSYCLGGSAASGASSPWM